MANAFHLLVMGMSLGISLSKNIFFVGGVRQDHDLSEILQKLGVLCILCIRYDFFSPSLL